MTFRLAGINNQNFLMRDEETGSFWQQISGQAISGPLRGRQLELVRSDELTFALWRAENPSGTVLRPVAAFEGQYEPRDWEVKMQKQRTVVDTAKSGIPPRELMLGLEVAGEARAYPLARVLAAKLIQDRLGGREVLLVVGPDGQSVRAFESNGAEFFRDAELTGDLTAPLLTDSVTGSRWSFHGCTAAGRCLSPLPVIKDYWFDWQLYHPKSSVFRR